MTQADVVLLRVVDISTVKTVVHVVERDYPKVEAGQEAQIAVDSYPGRPFAGKVTRKAPVLDPLTRTAAVTIEIANPERLLKPGMHTRVRLVFDRHKQAKVLPVAALLDDGGRREVYVAAGEPPQVVRRRVTTGYTDGDVVEIVSGLGPGDRAVIGGAAFLKEGAAVAVRARDASALASSDVTPKDGGTQSAD
jgi:membrane fusion protein (multidrug efflux system)